MALILDESFLTAGSLTGFATIRSAGTVPTITYNAGQLAADITMDSTTQMIWDITSQTLRATGEFEFDIETLTDYSAPFNAYGGVYLLSGVGAVSNGVRLTHYGPAQFQTQVSTAGWYRDLWNAPSAIFTGNGVAYSAAADNVSGTGFAFTATRRLLNVRFDMAAVFPKAQVEFRVGGVLIFAFSTSGMPATIRPGVYSVARGLRVHGLKVWDTPQVALGNLPLTTGFSFAPPRTEPSTNWAAPEALTLNNPKARTFLPVNGAVDFSVPEQDTMNNPRARTFLPAEGRKIQAPVEQLTNTGQASRSLQLIALGRNTMGAPQSKVSGPPNAVFQGKTIAIRNMYQGGMGRISGTVKEKSSPTNNPVYREVLLFDEKTMLFVRTAWSDKLTGAYSFDYVDQYHTYSVFAYDHTGSYRAVIANNQIPVVIP